MNGYQRTAAALAGRRPDRTPVMLHNFMVAAREAGISMKQFRADPQCVARAYIEAVEKYGYDAILIDIDTATLGGAIGVPVEFPDDEPALCRGFRLSSLEQVRDLEPPDVARYPGIQVWLEAARLLKRYFGDEIYVRGNCDQAAFSLAAFVRSISGWLVDVSDPANEESVYLLLDYCAEATSQFLRLMADTGVHALSNGDSTGGPSIVGPRLCRKYVLPYEKRIASFAHSLDLPYVLHMCGKTDPVLAGLAEVGADGLDLDQTTDAVLAHSVLKDRVTFIGNVDPSGILANGTSDDVERECRKLIDLFADTPRFILNAGCAIPAGTSPENIRAMIATARTYVPDKSRQLPNPCSSRAFPFVDGG